MKALFQVLSAEERAAVHERTLYVLSTVGMRVDTAEGRRILATAGAQLVEEARAKVDDLLAGHTALPLPDDVERELERLRRRAE
jgi:trimethylamine:corrinoid methyltransferase-like protein